ncbi:unnamed protein product [Leptidea sinapis]|uniref:Cilia- and flagella-associated protein 36 n=1 Tax=Leptidea sinapis TaxID=189913 RepID=A0A5E4QDW9_9NEOP|nr:unnamed protein product [Leptidea sinapis]
MDNLDNNAWVFDSLIGFLHGPIWNVPLQTFIEEKSLPFEPTEDGEVFDREEYKKIHDDYKNLVDVMLGSFMDDIGISADQFEAACKLSAHDLAGLPSYFHKRLFEQIWAANDYEMFVKMMTHKNVELQLQALELIEKRFGTLPSLFSSGTDDLDSSRSDESADWPDNDDVMMEIKKLQLNDVENHEEILVPPEEVMIEKQNLLTKLHSFDTNEDNKKEELPIEIPVKAEIPKPAPKKQQVSEEEICARQEYLKQQRDKLLALKKQVRQKQLGGEGPHSVSRPKSARIAKAALSGSTPLPAVDAMQLRRALATKLKTEVVDGSH